jgi:hypothetical protein
MGFFYRVTGKAMGASDAEINISAAYLIILERFKNCIKN